MCGEVKKKYLQQKKSCFALSNIMNTAAVSMMKHTLFYVITTSLTHELHSTLETCTSHMH